MAALPIYRLTVGDEVVVIHRKRIKHIYLAVRPADGRITVSAPLRIDDTALAAFILSKTNWIRQRRATLLTLQRQRAQRDPQYVSGEQHYFRGDGYQLNVIYQSSLANVALRDNRYIDVYIREHASREQRRKVLTEWYRWQLKQLIPPLIEKWQPIINVAVNAWGVKQMKTRWGTCNIPAQRIWLNLELIKKPPVCLEYVVVHEMVHLLERSHNARFKAYMDKFLPNWRKQKAALNFS
ncbi:MAG TPA: SprT family zinc-dependent metalloprotease [Gammaproteobacteria bacterium]